MNVSVLGNFSILVRSMNKLRCELLSDEVLYFCNLSILLIDYERLIHFTLHITYIWRLESGSTFENLYYTYIHELDEHFGSRGPCKHSKDAERRQNTTKDS